MFCYQCQETKGNTGCVKAGVCGKPDDVSNLQDVLIYTAKGISTVCMQGGIEKELKKEADVFVMEALFETVTNVSFSRERVLRSIKKGLALKQKLLKKVKNKENMPDCALWYAENEKEIEDKYADAAVTAETDEDIRSLKEFVIYGLKGVAAYLDHAFLLGRTNPEIFDFMHRAMAKTAEKGGSSEELLALVVETGKYSAETMALLDAANTETYGKQEITKVSTGTKKGKAILISGHDLKDLHELLEQTRDKGINVYTHGEMLPANAYPVFKKYSHLAGNYGTSWWAQQKEFEDFSGAILMTTNCIQKPRESYKDRIFTTGLVSFDGIKHIPDREKGREKDFSEVIEKALSMEGLEEKPGKELTIGFAHHSVLSVADKVVEAVKSGAIKEFVVMAGCDGRNKEREYFTRYAEKLPADSVILTAGCAKYRYNMLDLGDIGGIPRLLDAGQCNDSYSLAVVAMKLKEVFGLDDINKLPIKFKVAWYEQKAVAVLLALLFLGFKNVAIGPTLPAFLTPNTAKVLVEKFGISNAVQEK